MKIAIAGAGTFGKTYKKESDHVPRIGDKIDLGYLPCPVVRDVVWWPKDEKLKFAKIDVLIIVK